MCSLTDPLESHPTAEYESNKLAVNDFDLDLNKKHNLIPGLSYTPQIITNKIQNIEVSNLDNTFKDQVYLSPKGSNGESYQKHKASFYKSVPKQTAANIIHS